MPSDQDLIDAAEAAADANLDGGGVAEWSEGDTRVKHHSLKEMAEFLEFMDRRKARSAGNAGRALPVRIVDF